jgi:hypothetical protein
MKFNKFSNYQREAGYILLQVSINPGKFEAFDLCWLNNKWEPE